MQVLVNYCNKSLYKAGHHIIALWSYLGSKLCLNGPILGVKQMLKPSVKQLTEIREYSNTRLKCVRQDLFWFTQVLSVIMRTLTKQIQGQKTNRPALDCD